jgi:hypothetical protein
MIDGNIDNGCGHAEEEYCKAAYHCIPDYRLLKVGTVDGLIGLLTTLELQIPILTAVHLRLANALDPHPRVHVALLFQRPLIGSTFVLLYERECQAQDPLIRAAQCEIRGLKTGSPKT